MKKICCIGHITRDRIITPQQTIDMAGGTSFYMAHGMHHLSQDFPFQLVTKIGQESQEEVDHLRQMNIDVLSYSSPHSVFFENHYGLNSNQRTQRVLAKAAPFTIEEMEPLVAEVFHLGSLLADDFSPEIVKFLAQKGCISIDVQGYLREVRGKKVYAVDWKDMDAVLPYVDIVKLNEHEMYAIMHTNDPKIVAEKLASYGVREVIITLGSYGSLIYANKTCYEIPAYTPQKIVDATGCGDTYSTGYLYMRSQGATFQEAGRFASAMCTLKLEHNGPFEGSLKDIEKLSSAPRKAHETITKG
ncbi:PfkB family carbohydrate kinase [Prevotella sp. HJM029]|uniref:PfkB family carbohydrate kinase n=1 Tax=Prevotella sp. HJM029 TaxID=1433844 RepID=UPI00068851F4|nr:PfkB family carbohydrate kinase [Prevotella sp. HJM029]